MLSNLFVAGTILIFTGLCWDLVFPMNKKIWTSSFVIYTSGLAMTVLSVFIYLIEFKNAKGAWSRFFDVFGKNPLFIFVLSGFLPRVLGLFVGLIMLILQPAKMFIPVLCHGFMNMYANRFQKILKMALCYMRSV